ncbi:MAG: redoxin domain-containing protein [Thiohalocapsa sp.]|jgi:hypothetical protein
MSRSSLPAGLLVLGITLALLLHAGNGASGPVKARRAPEFTQTATDAWINSAPLRLRDLRGQVVLLDIWTFACWNCYRSFPWLRQLEARYAPLGLQLVGIHSPEFERERDPVAVRAKVKEFALEHPVMIDNDLAYWRALDNRAWPTFYLIDKAGRIRYQFLGETHAGEPQALRIQTAIEALLEEAG